MTSDAQRFIAAFLDFDEVARSNVGFDAALFEEACTTLRALGPEFRRTGGVPLPVANVFVDMYLSIESSSHRHGEAMRRQLQDAAEALAAIAREVTASD